MLGGERERGKEGEIGVLGGEGREGGRERCVGRRREERRERDETLLFHCRTSSMHSHLWRHVEYHTTLNCFYEQINITSMYYY